MATMAVVFAYPEPIAVPDAPGIEGLPLALQYS
jgi:hypothetical protein